MSRATMPIEITYRGEDIFLHEPGCQCEYDHDGRFVDPNAKVSILTTLDEGARIRYHQIWFRTGAWSLHDALEQLLERKRNGSGGRAA